MRKVAQLTKAAPPPLPRRHRWIDGGDQRGGFTMNSATVAAMASAMMRSATMAERVKADDPDKLQQRCRALGVVTAAYGVPLGADSLEVMGINDCDIGISLEDGGCSAPKSYLKVLGAEVDPKGCTAVAISAREEAVIGIWPHHREWRVPLTTRLPHVCAIAGFAFLYGAGGGSCQLKSGGSALRLRIAGFVP